MPVGLRTGWEPHQPWGHLRVLGSPGLGVAQQRIPQGEYYRLQHFETRQTPVIPGYAVACRMLERNFGSLGFCSKFRRSSPNDPSVETLMPYTLVDYRFNRVGG